MSNTEVCKDEHNEISSVEKIELGTLINKIRLCRKRRIAAFRQAVNGKKGDLYDLIGKI